MPASFTDYTDSAGEHRWRLTEANGRTIADSSEGYTTAQARNEGRELFTTLGGSHARVSEVDAHSRGEENPEYEYFLGRDGRPEHAATDDTKRKVPIKKADGDWYWRFRAGNGEIIADGGEGYASEANVKRAITNVQRELDRIAREKPGGHGGTGGGTGPGPGPNVPPSRFA